jgi:hypothetical protein
VLIFDEEKIKKLKKTYQQQQQPKIIKLEKQRDQLLLELDKKYQADTQKASDLSTLLGLVSDGIKKDSNNNNSNNSDVSSNLLSSFVKQDGNATN